MDVVDTIFELFTGQGGEAYGEHVTQTEHALQTAALAKEVGAPGSLVVAALLHDIGHMLSSDLEDAAERCIDDRHEISGSRWLARHFGPDVTEPIRLHVQAKRYLCTVDAGYFSTLSPASARSFALQGGRMSLPELEGFHTSTYYQDAVLLRQLDDRAKVPKCEVPDLELYPDLIRDAVC